MCMTMASVFGGFGGCVHSLLKRHPRHHHQGEAEGRKSKERNESSCLYLQTVGQREAPPTRVRSTDEKKRPTDKGIPLILPWFWLFCVFHVNSVMGNSVTYNIESCDVMAGPYQ